MPVTEPKIFDLSAAFPQVILVGNGLTNYAGCFKPWNKVISDYAGRAYDARLDSAPYSVQGTVYSYTEDNLQHKRYVDTFLKNYQYNSHPIIKRLIELKSDAILTTNYTYEIEYNLNEKYVSLKNKDRYAFYTDKDSRFLMKTFNRIAGPENEVRDIWHIHGEIRRPSSIVFTHDEYVREIADLVAVNKSRGNVFLKNSEVGFNSWFDYIILSDLYILGLGFDFSELDLWWLLNRRRREKAATGKVFFFEPYDNSKQDVYAALDKMGIKVENLGFGKTHNLDIDRNMYKSFYKSALEETERLISLRRGKSK